MWNLSKLRAIQELEGTSLEDWPRVSKKASWDRHVPLETWRERIGLGRKSYLPQSVEFFSPSEFAAFYGVEAFKRDWPGLRGNVPKSIAARRLGLYDGLWSLLVSNTIYLRPWAGFWAMPRRRQDFLIEVARTPGASTYEIGKRLGMQYRRAYDHRLALSAEGRILQKEVIADGRRKIALYPGYGRVVASSQESAAEIL